MKRNKLMIAFRPAVAFPVECNKERVNSQKLRTVQAKAEEAAQMMKDYSSEQNTPFVERPGTVFLWVSDKITPQKACR